MSEECVVIAILKMLNEGSKTEVALNLFLFTNFSRWKTEYLRDFIDEIKHIIERKHQDNKILICYNPILAISLSCEALAKIAICKDKFHDMI